jgi:hypothetical protein
MDLARLSTASKLLLGAGLLLFIDLFLSWQKICVSFANVSSCGSRSGWHGWGTLAGILLVLLLAWELIQITEVAIPNVNVPVAIVSAALAAGVLLFTIIKFLADNEARHWPAWLGLLLALIIGAGAFLRWQERDTGAATRGTGLGSTGGTTGTTTTTPPSSTTTGTTGDYGGTTGGGTTTPPGGTTGTTGEGTETTPPA